MRSMNRFFYQTVSCRTSAQRKLAALRGLLLCLVFGVAIGTLCYCLNPLLAESAWLHHGFLETTEVRSLWQVFVQAALPSILLFVLLLLSSFSAVGQALPILCLLARGVAIGLAMADCFAMFRVRIGFCVAIGIILPHAFFSSLLLAYASRDAIRLSSLGSAYLFRGTTESTICEQRRMVIWKSMAWMILTTLSAAVDTLFTWLFCDRLFGQL